LVPRFERARNVLGHVKPRAKFDVVKSQKTIEYLMEEGVVNDCCSQCCIRSLRSLYRRTIRPRTLCDFRKEDPDHLLRTKILSEVASLALGIKPYLSIGNDFVSFLADPATCDRYGYCAAAVVVQKYPHKNEDVVNLFPVAWRSTCRDLTEEYVTVYRLRLKVPGGLGGLSPKEFAKRKILSSKFRYRKEEAEEYFTAALLSGSVFACLEKRRTLGLVVDRLLRERYDDILIALGYKHK